MTVTRIPEVVVPGKRLGRHLDARIAAHRETGGPPPMAKSIVSVNHNAFGLPLDQGQLGSCTANALCGALNSRPHYASNLSPRPRTLNETDAVKLYKRETADEGQPYPPNDPGGTGIAVCTAAIELGLCSDFQVASGINEALLALVLRPVITGVYWFDSFDSPDANGLVSISPGAQIRGGHEIVADGIDASRKLVWLWNSWGQWGDAGRFCMSYDTWDTLLQQNGDVVVPRTAKNWHA